MSSNGPSLDGRGPSPERELMLRLAGTAESRERSRAAIRRLVAKAAFDRLHDELAAQSLLPILGSRLSDLAPDSVPERFVRQLAGARAALAYQGTLFEAVTRRLLGELDRAGVAVVAIKGSLMGARLYGDLDLRPSSDIDLLVDADAVADALVVLERSGYGRDGDPVWEEGRPLLHHTLVSAAGLPPVELHWRVHWYETRFSRTLVERSRPDAGGGRRLNHADELALLLLYFARDGLYGLRMATDVAAWWDAYGARLPARALDPVLLAHPELRAPLLAATAVLQRLVGLPAERLVSDRWRRGRRVGCAERLANWSQSGTEMQVVANLTLVDWLLSPPRGNRAFLRRHFSQPLTHIAKTYALPEDARARQVARGALHTCGQVAKVGPPAARSWWLARRGREWAPIPEA